MRTFFLFFVCQCLLSQRERRGYVDYAGADVMRKTICIIPGEEVGGWMQGRMDGWMGGFGHATPSQQIRTVLYVTTSY